MDGPNRYLFVSNDPVNYVDPWGWCKDKPWWENLKDRFKELFGIEPPQDAVYLNLFFHSSVTVIRNGQKETYGFGPDSRREFPWQTPSGEKPYFWPISSPGVISYDPALGIPILTTKDPRKVNEIAEGIRIAQEQSPGTNYSVGGVDCILWAIEASSGNFPEGQRK